jgi:hypothetical protein
MWYAKQQPEEGI